MCSSSCVRWSIQATVSIIVAGSLCLPTPAVADAVPGAIHVYDAALDTTDNNRWEDTGSGLKTDILMKQTGDDYHLGGAVRVPVTSSNTLLNYAYKFDGVDDYGDIDSENFSGDHDATFDMWFKPNGFQPPSVDNAGGLARTIYENGNRPRGVTIGMNGDTLIFAFGAFPTLGYLTYDLDTNNDGIPDNPDFIHVCITIQDSTYDPDPTQDWIRMYVDGGHKQELQLGGVMDWSSNDLGGMARNVTQDGGGQKSTEDAGIVWGDHWNGEVAILREYRFTFTDQQVMQNYLAEIPQAIPGDANGDGIVDGLDYIVWAMHFGENPAQNPPGSPANGDFNGDNTVDGLDYIVWATNYGAGAATTVPEPSTMLLVLWGASITLIRRRRNS